MDMRETILVSVGAAAAGIADWFALWASLRLGKSVI